MLVGAARVLLQVLNEVSDPAGVLVGLAAAGRAPQCVGEDGVDQLGVQTARGLERGGQDERHHVLSLVLGRPSLAREQGGLVHPAADLLPDEVCQQCDETPKLFVQTV